MIPAQFEYHAPSTVAEALQLLKSHGAEAKLLAGGHSLLPLMKLRLATPAHLIDLGRVDGLRSITEERGTVVVGAMTTHWQIQSSDLLAKRVPLMAEAAASIGDLQVRNMGTIGGSLSHADPAADYPASVLALEAQLVAEGPGGRRTISAADFFTGLYTTALGPDEILLEVRIAAQAKGAGSAYKKFVHPASGFAVVGVAAVLTLGASGTCSQARIGVTGVASVAYRARGVEEALTGKPLDEKTIVAAAARVTEGVDVNADVFAGGDYRRHVAGVYTKRAIMEATSRAKTA